MKFFLIMFFLFSCASYEVIETKHTHSLEAFVKTWKADYSPLNNPKYSNAYEAYLYSVEELYKANQVADKFESYVFSLKNYYQVMAHTEFANPSRNPRAKKQALANMKWRLSKERREKIVSEVGPDIFKKLLENHRKQRHAFPL